MCWPQQSTPFLIPPNAHLVTLFAAGRPSTTPQPPFPPKTTEQMGRVRVRQHVNPLASQFQRPAPSVDWAQVYQDPIRPLFVVSAAAASTEGEATAAGARFKTDRAAVAAQHLQICVSSDGDLLRMQRWPHLRVCCVGVCTCV